MSISQVLDNSPSALPTRIEVASAVKQSREAVGYSVDQLAITCGLTNNEIVGIEDGADADPAKLRRIGAAFGSVLQVLPSRRTADSTPASR